MNQNFICVWNDTSHKMDDIGLYGCFEDTDDMWLYNEWILKFCNKPMTELKWVRSMKQNLMDGWFLKTNMDEILNLANENFIMEWH